MIILCTVDITTREVTIPSDQRIASYDHKVDVIRFQVETIPGFSLNTSSIKIAAQGPNKARHDYAVDPSTVAIEEETGYITFDWPIPAGVTEMPIGSGFKYGDRGQLIFAVCAEIISGSTVSKAWHSDDGIITVVAHLEPEAGGGEDPEETATNAQKIAQLQTDVAVINTQVGALANGSPAPVATVSEMADESAVYLYTGSETGYTAGNWYFWNGTAWTSGGTYGGAVTDSTLSIEGAAADAKAVGDALALKADADDLTAVQTAVAGKADSSDVIALDTRVTAVEGALEDKADTSDVTAVEDAIDDLESDLNSIEPIFSDCFTTVQHTNVTTNNMTWTEGKYFDLNTGEEKSLNGYSHTEKFPCEAGDVVGIGLNIGQVLFWNGSTYLSYVATSGSTGMNITAPAGATLYACNNRDVNYRPDTTTLTKTWTEKVLISKEYDAPAQVLYTSDAFINKRYANTVNGNLLIGDSYASWYCVYKMPCKANHNYRTTHQTQVCFYDAQGTFISAYIPKKNGANVTGAKVEMDFTTPANCAYISINSNFANECVFDLSYVEYGNSKSVYNLIGKTIVCFGDSITGNYCFGDNYPYQIEKETGAKVYNVGFGGCRMELTNESSILYVNPFSMVSLADAIVSEASDKWSTQDSAVESFAAKTVIYKRLEMLKNIDFSQVDIITIAYGTNGIGLPLDDSENPLNTYTYAGATRYAVKTLLTKYPHLRIVLLTPIYRWYNATSDDGDTHQVSGQTLLDRVTKLLEVGAEIKIPTIDLYHTLGINKYNYTGYFGDDDETADGTHINSFGREQMGLRVAGELNRLF